MSEPQPIVVGIDFTPPSAIALREAARLGSTMGAPVRPVHIIDRIVAVDLTDALPPGAAPTEEDLISDAARAWAEYSRGIGGAGGLRLEVRVGHRVRGIVSYAREVGAVRLVLGAAGHRGARAGVGTVAAACVRKSAVDVLIVREGRTGPFRRVAACVDFSEHSTAALRRAGEVAVRDGSELHVLHVFRAPWHRLHYRAPTPESDPHVQRQFREALERRLKSTAEDVLGRAVAESAVFAVIDHREEHCGILEYVAKAGADLIVVGSHGRTDLLDVLLGTTTEAVLREAECSVLAVKTERARRAAEATESDVETTEAQRRLAV